MINVLVIKNFQEVGPNIFKVNLNFFDDITNRYYSENVLYDNGFISGPIYDNVTSPLSTKSRMKIKTYLIRYFNN
ncbi:hypothetical protein CIL03_11250 [Virgibacillus indicus]|uniref:Uncharacterized protein n=1 Tax=Virgibacillus indicus TaxID=2024554 RepID=A0A265N8A6_9BACI|nr:hypothetical protein CIL03_11250 [Virgibacillus indicus]